MKKKSLKSVVPVAKIKNNLRRIHMHCPYRTKAKNRSKIDSALYKCEGEDCKIAIYEGTSDKNYFKLVEQYKDQFEVIRAKIELDHKSPVIEPKKGFGNWHEYIHALWVDDSGYQCLCRDCHAEKTAKEAGERAEAGTLKRKK